MEWLCQRHNRKDEKIKNEIKAKKKEWKQQQQQQQIEDWFGWNNKCLLLKIERNLENVLRASELAHERERERERGRDREIKVEIERERRK